MVLTAQQIILQLFRLGYANAPGFETGITTETQLAGLDLASPEVTLMIKAYQASPFMRSAFEDIYQQATGQRKIVVDGKIGPLTEKLLMVDRCAYPDYTVAGAEAAFGVGRWPHSTDPQYPGVHVIKMWIDKQGTVAGTRPGTYGDRTIPIPGWLDAIFEDQIWPYVYESYLNIGIMLKRVDRWQDCNICAGWPIPPGNGDSTIGLAIVPGGALQGTDVIWSRFKDWQSDNDRQRRLFAHEWGHNMGLPHSNGGIMNPSILGGPFTRTAWRGDPSQQRLTEWYGGEPVIIGQPPIPPTDPPVPPTGTFIPGDWILMNTVTKEMYEFRKKVMT